MKQRGRIGEYNNPEQEQLLEWVKAKTPNNAVFCGSMPVMANLRCVSVHYHFCDPSLSMTFWLDTVTFVKYKRFECNGNCWGWEGIIKRSKKCCNGYCLGWVPEETLLIIPTTKTVVYGNEQKLFIRFVKSWFQIQCPLWMCYKVLKL